MLDTIRTCLARFLAPGRLERPPIDFSADGWYGDTFAGQTDRKTALTVSAVWRATSLISGYVGKLPCFVYVQTPNGKERATTDPAYRLCRHSVAPNVSAMHFRQTLTAHALLTGNGYGYVFRDMTTGRADEIAILDPENTYRVTVDGTPFITTSINGKQHKLDPSNVIHIRGMGFDGLTGYSVLAFAAESIGMASGAQKHGKRYFDNGTALSGVLEHPATMSEEAIQRLRGQWSQMYSGVDAHHKTAILEEGLKYSQIRSHARDCQLVETMKFSLVDIANWFGVPPHKLGDSSRTAYNSLEQENQAFLDDALDYWLVLWEQELRDKLLTEDQKESESHFVEFERKALVRADLKSRSAYYQIATGGRPWMTPDEVRTIENQNRVGGEAGVLKDPTNNFQPSDATTSTDTNTDAGQRAAEIHRQAMDRMVGRISNCLKRAKTDADKTAILADCENDSGEHGRVLREVLAPTCDLLTSLGTETRLENEMRTVIERAMT